MAYCGAGLLRMRAPMLPLLAALAAMHLLSPAAGQTLLDGSGCVIAQKFDTRTKYFTNTFEGEPFALPLSLSTTVKSAYNFTVSYANSYKIVKDTHANTTYLLYICGAPLPKLSSAPALSGTFQIPLESYGIVTTVPAAFAQLLGVAQGVRQVQMGPVVDPCLQKLLGGLSSSAGSSFSGPMVNASTGPFNAPSISFSAAEDPGVLSRAEWIKYLALFFNKEAVADAVFNNISSAYLCLNGSAPASEAKPTIAWLNFYNGTWTLSGAAYKLQYVADAGAVSPPEVVPGEEKFFAMANSSEAAAFKAMLETVDIVMDETFLPEGPSNYSTSDFVTNAGYSEGQTQSLKCLNNVWSIYGTYSAGVPYPYTAWYEGAIAQPQVVLEEILAIAHPSMFPATFSHTYFYNVATGKANMVSASNCSASDMAAMAAPRRVSCPREQQQGNAANGSPAAARHGSLALTAGLMLGALLA